MILLSNDILSRIEESVSLFHVHDLVQIVDVVEIKLDDRLV